MYVHFLFLLAFVCTKTSRPKYWPLVLIIIFQSTYSSFTLLDLLWKARDTVRVQSSQSYKFSKRNLNLHQVNKQSSAYPTTRFLMMPLLFIYINTLETVPLCVTLQTKLQKLQPPNLTQVCYIASG